MQSSEAVSPAKRRISRAPPEVFLVRCLALLVKAQGIGMTY